MKPVVFIESKEEFDDQYLLDEKVYLDVHSFYLKYMQLYRLEFGNVDEVISLPNIKHKIDQARAGDVIVLCKGTYTGELLCCKSERNSSMI